jgi:histidyl-tRNA synthetase
MSLTPTDFIKTAHKTAEHYGFSTVETLKKDPACKDCKITLPHTVTGTNKRIDSHNGLLCSGITTYCESRLHAIEKPILLYSVEQTPYTGEPAITFHVFNVEKSIAEALLIQVSRALANDLGYTDHTVRINSLGDKDSLTRYTREATNFLKKRIDTMSPTARELMKEHTLLALNQLIEEEHELGFRSPNPMEFLSDQSRKHFREIIEYLDMSQAPYEIDPKMLGHHECYSDAIFSIDIHDEDAPLVIRGGRIDEFARRATRTQTPAAGAVVTLRNTKIPARIPRIKSDKPAVYVVHLGFGPKIRGLMMIDELRAAGIPVLHGLASDSLSEQLRDAEKRGVAYTIIIGQKEYVENTVILRDMQARNQEFIDQDTAIKRLKRKKAVLA